MTLCWCSAEREISRVNDWFDSFQLFLNLNKKTHIASSLTEKNRHNFNELKIKDDFILITNHTNYFGVLKLRHKFYTLKEFLNEKLLGMAYWYGVAYTSQCCNL